VPTHFWVNDHINAYGFFFALALIRTTGNLTISRLAAETLSRQRPKLQAAVLHILNHEGDEIGCLSLPYLPTSQPRRAKASAARDDLKLLLYPGSMEAVDCFISSAMHHSHQLKVFHHQILVDVRFTEIDIAYR